MRKTYPAVLLLALNLVFSSGCGVAGAAAPAAPVQTPAAVVETTAPPETAAPRETATAAADTLTAAPAAESETTAQDTLQEPDAAAPSPTAAAAPEPSEEAAHTCSLYVRCDTILDNLDKLAEEKKELVPGDGVVLWAEEIAFTEGESVFDLLLRVTREEKIHMEFTDTPLYHSAYVEGIGNLYEFDCGELSGWSYKVNGEFPQYGCSIYELQDGDVVEWVYTCDLGRDVGGSNEWEGGS